MGPQSSLGLTKQTTRFKRLCSMTSCLRRHSYLGLEWSTGWDPLGEGRREVAEQVKGMILRM